MTQDVNSDNSPSVGDKVNKPTQGFDALQFATDGYCILSNLLDRDTCQQLSKELSASLQPLVGPAEYEADVGYPGSPDDRGAPGGQTPRRLLHAYSRSADLRHLAAHPTLVATLKLLFEQDEVLLSQCHHNCVMTKHPGFSSATLWHQDIRYWSFDQPRLISAWFALGAENRRNGALRVIPGSHVMDLDRGRFDKDLFLRPELDANRELIRQARPVELAAGDVLLFHCRLFHAAGKNLAEQVKLSPVFTYHGSANQPIPGTRSSQFPSISVG